MINTTFVEFALGVLLQSTLLIAVGLLAARICGATRPALQSAVLRTTLLAVLACPLLSLGLARAGVTGFDLIPAIAAESAGDLAIATTPVTETHATAQPGLPHDSANENTDDVSPQFDAQSVAVDQEVAMHPVAVAAEPSRAPASSANPATTQQPSARPSEQAASTPTHASGEPVSLGGVLAGFWAVVAAALMAKLVLANLLVIRLCRRGQAADKAATDICLQTAHTLRLRSPRIRRSGGVHSPCLVGIVRPTVLLPVDANLDEAALRDVLLHELAHLARRDCLFHFLSRVASAVLFFQPLVWWLNRRLEQVAEDVCDDYVMRYGTDRKGYAHTLVDFAESRAPQWAPACAGLGVVSLRSSLSRRVLRILDNSRTLSIRLSVGWLLALLFAGVSATTLAAMIGSAEADDVTAAEDVENKDATTNQPAADKADAPATDENTFRFAGRVVDPRGEPVQGAELFLFSWKQPIKDVLAQSDEKGNFSFEVKAPAKLYEHFAESGGRFLVVADGFGLAVKSAHECETTGVMARAFRERYAASGVSKEYTDQALKRILSGSATFELTADDAPLSGRVVDIQGRPVAGALIQVCKISDAGRGGLDAWEKAAEKPDADTYSVRRLLGLTLGNDVGGDVLKFISPAKTNDKGEFALPGIGRDRVVKLLISGPGVETTEVHARTRPGKPIEINKEPRNPGRGKVLYQPAKFTHIAGPSEAVEGTVVDAKTKKPLADVTIQSYQLAGQRLAGWTQGIVRTKSDKEGKYRLEGLPIGDNRIIALTPIDQPYIVSGHRAETKAGEGPTKLDIPLTRGVWIQGKAFDVGTGEPIRSGRVGYFAFTSNPHAKKVKGFNGAFLSTRYRLNPDGTYRIPGIPGRGIVAVMADRDHDKYQRGAGSKNIEGKEGGSASFRTFPYILSPFNYHVLIEVNPTPADESIEVDFEFSSGTTLYVSVVGPDGKPMPDCEYSGRMEFRSFRQARGEKLEIYGYRPENPRRVQVIHRKRKLTGMMVIDEKEPGMLKITLQPWAEVKGRIVDEAGVPKANVEIGDIYSEVQKDPTLAILPSSTGFQNGRYYTDDEGRFHIAGLVPGTKLGLYASENRKDGIGYSLGRVRSDVELKPGQVHDLGDLKLKQRDDE